MQMTPKVFTACLLALVLCSCTKLRETPCNEKFHGIHQSFGKEKTVSIVLVHGIGGYSEGDPDSLIAGIVDELSLCPTEHDCIRRVWGGEPEEAFGWVRRDDYLEQNTGTEFRVYTVDWRETTWEEKALLRDLEHQNQTQHSMLPQLYSGRQGFINNGLADVALYLGKYGPAIRYPLQQALRWVYEDSADADDHKLVIVTYSMGCHLVLEALDEMCHLEGAAPECSKVRRSLIDDTHAFFMLSCELPLLYFAGMQPPTPPYVFQDGAGCEFCEHCWAGSSLGEPRRTLGWDWLHTPLGRFMEHKREINPDFQIVVINDPNDLLSYRVEDVFIPEGADRDVFINVDVRNVKRSLFGQFADPIKAHEGYGKNPSVIRMIAHGTCGGCSPECPSCTCSRDE